MKRTRGSGRTAVALAVVLAVVAMLAAKCPGDKAAEKVLVRAVARGALSAAPFFVRLGTDIAVGMAMDYLAGELKGGAPGLYGGTRDAGHCDKAKLVEYLEKPQNRGKAKEWARTEKLGGVGEIRGFVKKLTPVLLRADTLVKNHDFKKGRAKAFDALLEAGIAVLVDRLGKPVVQCSCGNPLAAYEKDIDEADVKFDDRNRKWASYDAEKLVKVEPAPEDEPVEVYQLVDVEDPKTGLAREAGSDGTEDEVLPEPPVVGEESVSPSPSESSQPSESTDPETVTVPDVRGQTVGDAQAALEARGFLVSTAEDVTDTAAPGTVLAQDPEPETAVPAGSEVTLTVASGGAVDPPSLTPGEPGDSGGTDDPGGFFGGTAAGGAGG